MDRSSLPYRACVGIALFNAERKVFVGERIDTPGSWQMPQGGIDEGENIETAAFRELKEETGTDKAEIIKIAEEKTFYDIPQETLDRLPWGNQYRGQEQTWVAIRFTGEDTDIDINADDIPEFSNWQWIELKDTLDLIVPFKRDTYERVIAMFQDIV